MTREEAIEYFKDMNECTYGNVEPIQMAIEALKKEPCEDAVSRQAVKEVIMKCETMSEDRVDGYIDSTIKLEVEIDNMSLLTPMCKKGKWILRGGYWRCSECKEKALLKLDKAKGNCKEYMPTKSNFCPNCGAKMVESQESEGTK